MRFALSTNWNARRHEQGEALVDEILSLGFQALELGYHVTEELAVGIRRRMTAGAVRIDSVHSYCPVPIGAPQGYPELYLLASLEEDERVMAKILLLRTLDFACSMGAQAVVLHAGRIPLKAWFSDLHTGTLAEMLGEVEGDVSSPEYQKILKKALQRRGKRVSKVFDRFCLSLDAILPRFEKAGVTLCLENLPSIEAFPAPQEMVMLKQRFDVPSLAYWNDMGHGQVREFMGWENHLETARYLLPMTRGIHIHDVQPLMEDHLPPGKGLIDFTAFNFYAPDTIIKVFEPASDVKPLVLADSLRLVQRAFATASTKQDSI